MNDYTCKRINDASLRPPNAASQQILQLKLIDLLQEATSKKLLHWIELDPDISVSALSGRNYRIEWVWWYNHEGITIDRQEVAISAGPLRFCFAWGTVGIRESLTLLGSAFAEWKDHIERIANATSKSMEEFRVAFPVQPASVASSDHELIRQLLWMLREATLKDRLRWHVAGPNDPNIYKSSIGTHEVIIEILHPTMNEDVRDVSVVARLRGLIAQHDFCSGSEGMYIIEEILAHGVPEWRREYERRIESLQSEIAFLNSVLSSSKGESENSRI